ncbi:MAG: hypothetical protein DRH12_11980 [Deltaproteobacteria bacterium]|nr:MAG: hypothetical protein DRH12_11980 [Deltaproteobacteria bacterium]
MGRWNDGCTTLMGRAVATYATVSGEKNRKKGGAKWQITQVARTVEEKPRIPCSATISPFISARTAEPSIARNVGEAAAPTVAQPNQAKSGRFMRGNIMGS